MYRRSVARKLSGRREWEGNKIIFLLFFRTRVLRGYTLHGLLSRTRVARSELYIPSGALFEYRSRVFFDVKRVTGDPVLLPVSMEKKGAEKKRTEREKKGKI